MGLAEVLNFLRDGTLADYGTAHAAANLSGVEVEFGEDAAEGVAVHSELLGGLALVAFVVGEDFEQVAALELTDSFVVGDSGAVHLHYETVEFALHEVPCLRLEVGSRCSGADSDASL